MLELESWDFVGRPHTSVLTCRVLSPKFRLIPTHLPSHLHQLLRKLLGFPKEREMSRPFKPNKLLLRRAGLGVVWICL